MLSRKIDDTSRFDEIVGDSKPMQELLELVSSAAASKATVPITGERGTGKELISEAIHRSTEQGGSGCHR
jgi:transcriptional regulator with PAS, ATPase and Fis domain